LEQDLTSPPSKNSCNPARRLFWRRRLGIRASLALEFALVGPIFFLFLFAIFEVAYDQFMQEVLDNSLQYAARQVQIGNTQTSTNSNYVSTYFCPYDGGLLNCGNVYVRSEVVTFTAVNGCTDFYDATTGHPPVVGGVLNLGLYWGASGARGSGSNVGSTGCDTAASSTGFVVPAPQQCVVMSAVYVEPSFLSGLILNRITYNSHIVRVAFSTAAFVTEDYTSTSAFPPC